MKSAVVLESPLARVATICAGHTADDQRYLEIALDRVDPAQPPLPVFRAWLPLSPKTIAELATMGFLPPDGLWPVDPRLEWTCVPCNRSPFLVDLVSVACSDEESHDEEARRLFVRRPRKVT